MSHTCILEKLGDALSTADDVVALVPRAKDFRAKVAQLTARLERTG
jgi:hypothetical protein